MSANFARSRSGLIDRFVWDFSFKNRKIIVPILIFFILVLGFIVVKNFIDMDLRLKRLSKFEPMYVLGINRDLNIGDVIGNSDLKPFLFYKNEFEKLKIKNKDTNLELYSLIPCDFDAQSGSLIGIKDVVGRVVKIPIYKNSFLRQEFLAPMGTVPGLINLIEKDHALADVIVPQTGFNVYIKPNDLVDISSIDRFGNLELIVSKVKVILVDSLPLGKAPLHVPVDERSKRHLTLSVPQDKLADITKSIKNKTLVITFMNQDTAQFVNRANQIKPLSKNYKNPFQALMMITGSKKEFITK